MNSQNIGYDVRRWVRQFYAKCFRVGQTTLQVPRIKTGYMTMVANPNPWYGVPGRGHL